MALSKNFSQNIPQVPKHTVKVYDKDRLRGHFSPSLHSQPFRLSGLTSSGSLTLSNDRAPAPLHLVMGLHPC